MPHNNLAYPSQLYSVVAALCVPLQAVVLSHPNCKYCLGDTKRINDFLELDEVVGNSGQVESLCRLWIKTATLA